MTRRWRAGVAALALALGVPAAPGAGALPLEPLAPESCRVVVFSPKVQDDGIGMCVGFLITEDFSTFRWTLAYAVYSTFDRGRTWVEMAGAGLYADDFTHFGGLVFSPGFATDRTAFLQTSDLGLMASTDFGATWHVVDPAAKTIADDLKAVPALAPAATPVTEPAAVVFVGANPNDDVRVSQGVSGAPAAGSLGDDRELGVPPTYPAKPALMLADVKATEANSTHNHAALFTCDTALVCDDKLYDFPVGTMAYRIWFASDYATSNTVFVFTQGATARTPMQAWISTNGGRKFSRWTSVDKLLAPHNSVSGYDVSVGLSGRSGSRALYLRITRSSAWHNWSKAPLQQIFRSDNRGASWKQVAYASYDGSKFRGNLPFFLPHGVDRRHFAELTVLPDGRMFAPGTWFGFDPTLGTWESTFTIWCSVDGGKKWERRCAK